MARRKLLISKKQIQTRVKELAREIDSHYCGKELILIGVLNGSIIFLADLIRYLKTPVGLDCIAASSYGKNTRASSKVLFDSRLKLKLKGTHVLLVDDILDTGGTVVALVNFLRSLHPASLELCVLLRKRVPRKMRIRPRFVGFDIPDHFVYGYGLDFREKFRNLPYIAFQSSEG